MAARRRGPVGPSRPAWYAVHVVTRQDPGRSLVDVVVSQVARRWGGTCPRAWARRLVLAGGAWVDGCVERRPGSRVPAGATVDVRVDPAHPPPCSTNPPAPSLAAAEVLFLDGSLVVVNKPPGLPFHATPDPRRTSLVDVVKAWLQARTGERDPYLGTHQRLDRDTSGVVLFTLAREANAAMARAFETHQVTKRYHALVHVRGRRAPSSWSVENRLGVVGRGRHARVAVVADGDQASTTFRVLEHWGPVALVEACPRTGRKHQVRVHLAGSGMPILGDASYGQDDGVGRVMLHAHALGLPHPADGRPLFLEAPYPPDLAEELARCRGGPPGRPPARGAAPR